MGQKINPRGFRTGVNTDWRVSWFAKKDYGRYLLEDKRIWNLIERRYGNAGLADLRIERLPHLKITLMVAKPGMVIGRGGAGLSELKEMIYQLVKAKVDVQVEEVKNADFSARLVGESVARSILRRMPVKRIMNQTAERVFAHGALGVKIIVSGVIGGPSSISRRERTVRGSVPTQTLRSHVDFARTTAFTPYGTLGIKVWIYLGEKKD